MKKIWYLLLLALLFSNYLMADNLNKLSASAKRCVNLLAPYIQNHAATIPESLQKELLLIEKNGTYYIRGFLQTESSIDENALKQLSIDISTRAGNIWIISVPIQNITQLNSVKGMKYFEADVPVHLLLDKVRTDIRANDVHTGLNLPAAYNGANVVVGIIDQSFDFTHPTFKNLEDNGLRIKQVWIQSANQGTPPVGYSYGAEFATAAAIIDKKYDSQFISHGAHVAGIAAGKGDGVDDTYKGIAPGAELVFVSYNGAGTNVIDAANYIFDYASSVGKPAVINMSFGVFVGPRDGTSLIDQAIENLSGPGRLFVGAAGNSGNTPMHTAYEFNGEETVHTVIDVPPSNPFLGGGGTTVDVWGDVGAQFEVSIKVLDSDGTELASAPAFYATSAEVSDSLTFPIDNQNVTAGIYTKSSTNTPNNRPNARLYLSDRANKNVVLSIKASSGRVHVWNTGGAQGGPVSDTLIGGLQMSGYLPGDSEYTIAEIGGSGKGVISVGAYTTMNEYQDFNGVTRAINEPAPVGERAPFSSIGPSLDGRTKPEITAPGNVVASALSSYDISFQFPFGPEIRTHQIMIDNRNYPFGVYEGTSMAAPVVTGVVALMLEAFPHLSPDQARNILAQTAREDDFTMDLPEAGTAVWGHGKVNAYHAVQLANLLSGRTKVNQDFAPLALYPNPTKEVVYFDLLAPEATIQVTDIVGKTVLQEKIYRTTNGYKVSLPNLSPGVYQLNIRTNQQNHYNRIFIH